MSKKPRKTKNKTLIFGVSFSLIYLVKLKIYFSFLGLSFLFFVFLLQDEKVEPHCKRQKFVVKGSLIFPSYFGQ